MFDALGSWLTAEQWSAVALSMRVAVAAVLFSLPFAMATAYLLARCRFPGRAVVDVTVMLPLVLPPVVTGYMLLLAFGRRGFLGQAFERCCGLVFSFRWTGAALASGVMAFPLLVRAIRQAIEAVDPKLEAAAGTLGAGRLMIFFTVTLPLALPGVVAGSVIGFAKALGEFGATITFVSNIPGETQTIPLALYSYTQVPDGDAAVFRLAMVSVVLAVGAVAVSEWFWRFYRRRTS